MTGWRLVADVGGTNVRFARADKFGCLENVLSLPSNAYTSFTHALRSYLEQAGAPPNWNACAIGAAGPVDGSKVTLTNRASWSISADEVSTTLAGAPVTIVNDLEAVAAALPHLHKNEVTCLRGPELLSPPQAPMIAINVGTGFGAAVISVDKHTGTWTTHASEAGHMTLAAATLEEMDLLGVSQSANSLESFLSGSGVCRLYQHLSGNTNAITAAEIFARAGDPQADKVVQITTSVLARVTGDLVLATGAWGGVFFCGSVATGWACLADQSAFRLVFENKDAMRLRMQNVPTGLIVRHDVALFGLAKLEL